MLHEIYCEQFHQKRIVFNPGLSVVLGTNAGDNSIGKSTFLLIIDYVFGGSTYAGIQRLFQSDLSEMVSRYDIIRRAELYREDIAVAAIDQEGVDRVTAAQAADELLSLKGVKASFVVFPSGENVQMSARSLGEVNVQVILEALGGGGNSTTAGGRVENTDVETVKSRLLEAIDAYLAGASIALVLAVLVCILVHQNDRLEALEKRTRQLEEQIQKQND